MARSAVRIKNKMNPKDSYMYRMEMKRPGSTSEGVE
jgi:hypothetical protein